MKKRILSLVLAVCMLASIFPVSARAVEVIVSGWCGENTEFILFEDGVLTIFGNGSIDYEFFIGDYNWTYGNLVTSLYIEHGVTAICDNAFVAFQNMETVSIPDSVTSIGYQAFGSCTSLTAITIPDSVTFIDEYAFDYCTSLSSVQLSNNISAIHDYTFAYCGLTHISIPEGVTSIGENAFEGCEKLTSISIPSSVTSIEKNAFAYCTELKEVNYPGTRAEWSNIQIGTGNDCLTINYCLDVWDFANSSSEDAFGSSLGGYYISANDYAKLISNLSNTEIALIVKSGKKLTYNVGGILTDGYYTPYIDWGGSCYGMSLWTCLVNQGILDANVIDSNIPELQNHLPTLDAKSAINFYHFQQLLGTAVTARNDFMQWAQRDQIDILEKLGKQANENGKPFLIRYEWYRKFHADGTVDKESEDSFAAHAVVGYGWEELSEPFEYEGRTYNYRILIYDCAYPNHLDSNNYPCDVNLYYNDDGTLCIPGHEIVSMSSQRADSKYDNGRLRLVTDDISSMNSVDYKNGIKNYELAWSFLEMYTNLQCTLKWKDNSAQISGLNVDCDTEDHGIIVNAFVNVTSEGYTAPSSATVTLPQAEEYTVSTEDGVLDFCFHNENYLTSVTAESSGSITFHENGNVSMSTEEPTAYYINAVANEGSYDLPWYKVEFSGENATEVSTERTENGILIHSDNLETIIVAVTDDEGTVEINTTADSDSALITQENGELVIAEDRDGDGTYETNITDPAHTEHEYGEWTEITAASCTTPGKETCACTVCGETMEQEIPILPHAFESGACTACGTPDPDWVEPTHPTEPEPTEPEPTEPQEPEKSILRVAGGNRFETANLVGDQIKAKLGIEKFDAVVVASGTDFADALAGSYLASAKKAPILLAYNDKINEGVKNYIKANLNPGGTVYILGGGKAVPESFKDGLEEQFTVNRLAGGNRFETNLLVLQEAGVGDKPILVCTGLDFADSLSASATKLPILLVYGNKLLPEQAAFMESVKGRELYIIGGEGAVSKNMETALTAYGTVERVAGGNRFETSVMIAEKFFTAPESAVLAYAWGFPDGLCGGPLAATMNAPLILTMEKYEAKAAEYIQSKGIASGTILGGEKLIPESSINKIFP